MTRRNILIIIGIASINPMKSFKQFLIEFSAEQETTECDINGICKVIRQYESGGNEQKIRSRYLDSKKLPTIGHGHLITPESEKIFAEVFPTEHEKNPEFGKSILAGKGSLTPDQVEKLFERDVRVRIPQIQKMIPNFGTMSSELQSQIASEHFRGMLQKSPKAVKMINSGDLIGASNEYLKAKDYREAIAPNAASPGIAKRMEGLSNALKTESERQKKKQDSSLSTNQALR